MRENPKKDTKVFKGLEYLSHQERNIALAVFRFRGNVINECKYMCVDHKEHGDRLFSVIPSSMTRQGPVAEP